MPLTSPTSRPPPLQVSASEQRLADTIGSLGALEQAANSFAARAVAERPVAAAPAPAPAPEAPQRAPGAAAGGQARRRRHLRSSLDAPARLREFWFPAAFSGALGAGAPLPFELLGEPWVLFRDAGGAAACVRDECAHRACPLSLVRAPLVLWQPAGVITWGFTAFLLRSSWPFCGGLCCEPLKI